MGGKAVSVEEALADQYRRISTYGLRVMRGLIEDELATREVEDALESVRPIRRCPHCSSNEMISWGKTKAGNRRLRCTDCRKTSTLSTGTLLAHARNWDVVARIVDDMLGTVPSSCRVLAKRLEIHPMTVWRWRQKICSALGTVSGEPSGIIEADETFFRESRKGSREWVRHERDPQNFPQPPRLPWHEYNRETMPRLRGLSKWQKPVLVLHDRANQVVAERLPNLRHASIFNALDRHVRQTDLLCSDSAGAYRVYGRQRGIVVQQINSRKREFQRDGVYHIQHANSLHSRMKAFIKPFRGPATRYLDRYLAWMLYRDRIRTAAATPHEFLRRVLAGTAHATAT